MCALPVYPVPSMRSTSVVAQHVSHPLLRVVSSRGGGLGATEELQVVRQMVVLVTWQPGATLLGHLAACERELSAESTCSLTIDGAHRRCLPPSLDPSSSLLSERRLLHFLLLSCWPPCSLRQASIISFGGSSVFLGFFRFVVQTSVLCFL